MEKYVFSRGECSTVNSRTGLIVRLQTNQVWAADDPFVLNNPGLFSDRPSSLCRTEFAPVESASAVPGVKRQVKRA